MFDPALPSDEKALAAHVRALAIERIGEFEKKIEAEFGMKVHAGVELEFFGEKGRRAKHLSVDKLKEALKGVPLVQNVVNDMYIFSNKATGPVVGTVVAGGLIISGKDPTLSVGSGLFSGGYALLVKHFARQYEVTLTNKQGEDYHPLASLAASVETVKEHLSSNKGAIGVDAISFQSKWYPHTLSYQTAPSQHVNVSLWKDKANMLSDIRVHNACEHALLDMQHDGALLMLTTRNAYDNLHKGYRPPAGVRLGGKSDGGSLSRRGVIADDKRFESRLPRADSDPYLAMLANVAALYEGLQRMQAHGEKAMGPAVTQRALPRDMYEAYNRFDESEMCKRLLGPKLHEAVLALFDKELSKDDILNWGHDMPPAPVPSR
ncbi:MAG: glutamine synthetase [Rickettsiales bacterium]|nr:glutamine synthetase [Rickettsiales bacterium]